MEAIFRVKSYSKQELAMLYNPDISPAAARNKLMEWIRLYPGLTEHLRASGLGTHAKVLTPAQVRLIVDALGEP